MLEHLKTAEEVLQQVSGAVLGKDDQIKTIMAAFLAGGHVLLEDIPGVGKTTLAMSFAGAMGLNCKRVQFTPDVMPSDLTGFSVYSRENDKFVYQEGAVFCNLLLADEITRTSPKTQSALLEVMEERKVSVEGVTREVPSPFLVIATQNPLGSIGTQALPEAQTDRFMVNLSLGYPDEKSELEIARTVGKYSRTESVHAVCTPEIFCEMQDDIHNIFIKDEIYNYILQLVCATRNHDYIEHGASPRATISMVRMSKAYAWLCGRGYVIPSDVQTLLPGVLHHRISLSATAKMNGAGRDDVIASIIKNVRTPYMGAGK